MTRMLKIGQGGREMRGGKSVRGNPDFLTHIWIGQGQLFRGAVRRKTKMPRAWSTIHTPPTLARWAGSDCVRYAASESPDGRLGRRKKKKKKSAGFLQGPASRAKRLIIPLKTGVSLKRARAYTHLQNRLCPRSAGPDHYSRLRSNGLGQSGHRGCSLGEEYFENSP